MTSNASPRSRVPESAPERDCQTSIQNMQYNDDMGWPSKLSHDTEQYLDKCTTGDRKFQWWVQEGRVLKV